MNLKPFFAYYGGKYRIAPHYPRPRHRVVVEPFAGAAGYATRHAERDVRLYEADPVVFGVWDYLIRVRRAELAALPLVEALAELPSGTPQEARWLIGFWLQGGRPSPRNRISKRAASRPNSTWGEAVRARLVEQVGSIRHWRVAHASWETVPPEEATYFVDPPYVSAAGRAYTYDEIDYVALAQWCRSLPGQVIVCEQDGADWLPFERFRDIRGQANRTTEVVWAT